MAPRPGADIFQFKEKDPKHTIWDYSDRGLQIGRQRIEGAFRAFSVADLQRSPPVITLREWTDLAHGKKRAKRPNNYPKFAAISHVWDPSDETFDTAKNASRPLRIRVWSNKTQQVREISWQGLVEAADAADQLRCPYLWLDFLCLDQIPRGETDREKELQIYNMANIYKNAKRVICMLGGVSAVQSLNSKTSWMDRAWTLQEATLNWNRTLAYVKWPYKKTNFVINPSGYTIKFTPVKRQSANSLMLIRLYHLLEMPSLTDSTRTTPPLGLPSGFKVVCLDGKMNTGRASDAAKNAMLSVYRGGTPELRLAGVWRAMLLRISTKPVDIVYSVMGLFNVQVDPYREDRNVQYLFNDLARKAAAIGKAGMGWLLVGGVLGSVGKLERDQTSFLIPTVPDYTQKEKPPRYYVNGKLVLSGNVVDDSRTSIKRYHIEFDTNSLPHIMCAVMLKVTNITSNASLKRYKTASLTIGGKRSTCKYHGKIYNGITAMMVGTVGSWGSAGPYDGQQYVMFMEWTRNGWVLKGDGIVNISEKWVIAKLRWHFTVGTGAQKVLPKWPCDGGNPMITTKRLPMSYGVLPLENYGVSEGKAPRKIQWFGFKGKTPLPEQWITFNFWNGPVPSKQELDRNYPLWLVACSSANPPDFTDVKSTSRLYSFIYLPMQLTDVSLGGPSIDALQVALAAGLNLRTYLVAVRFTKYMIYLKSVPDKVQRRLNPLFTNTAVVSYSRKNTQMVLNSDYVVTQVKETIFLLINNHIEKQGTDPYSGFTMRLQNINSEARDWIQYLGVIPGTYPGDILWTDGKLGAGFTFPTFRVVRRDPNTGAVIASGLVAAISSRFKPLGWAY